VKHWHGGSSDTSFAHIAANTNPELTGLSWFDRISDEEYNQLPTEKAEDPAEESAEAAGKAVERHPDGAAIETTADVTAEAGSNILVAYFTMPEIRH